MVVLSRDVEILNFEQWVYTCFDLEILKLEQWVYTCLRCYLLHNVCDWYNTELDTHLNFLSRNTQ